MHDIWNPWHGCRKKSEGCDHCYMYYLDSLSGKSGSDIYLTKNMNYPLGKTRSGEYRIKSGERIRVSMTSDFFLEEADEWRQDAWLVMRARPDVIFFLLTKRPERVMDALPDNWGCGWDNVMLSVTCENQARADERIPILLSLPFRHKGIMCAPFIGEISIKEYLCTGMIEEVIAGGENYDGARPLDFSWVKKLRAECVESNVSFAFIETGTEFIKDGKLYHMPDKRLQSRMAFRSGMGFTGKKPQYILRDSWNLPIPEEELYKPHFRERCNECGSRMICNGCSECGRCR